MISVDWTILLQFVNFVVLLLVLNALLYRPLRAVLQERREKVEGSRQKAEELDQRIQEKMATYQERLQEAKSKATAERGTMKAEALQQEAALLGEARDKANVQIQGLKAKVATEAEKARQELRSQTDALAASIAGKVLGREL